MHRTPFKHRLLQSMFWNPIGSRLVDKLMRIERTFDVVVRGHSLMGFSNGENWLRTLMDEKPVVFDVGFHDGASTRSILEERPKAAVVGFDPSRFALACYRKEFEGTSVKFENAALSQSPGEIEFYDYENMCNSLAPRKEDMKNDSRVTTYRVPVTTLDLYCDAHGIAHINFLKIDAEGFDLHVLEGGRTLLQNQGVDILMFEFASGWAASKRYLWEAVEYFEPLPYRLYQLYNGFLCPLEYSVWIDSACTLSTMYVGVSERRMARGDIPLRNYRF